MKTIIKAKKGEYVEVTMGDIVEIKEVDCESTRVEVVFFIGYQNFKVKGTLNKVTNTFHQDSENEKDNEKYFEGYNINFAEVIENR